MSDKGLSPILDIEFCICNEYGMRHKYSTQKCMDAFLQLFKPATIQQKKLGSLKFIPSIPYYVLRLDFGKLFFHLELIILRNDSSVMWCGWKFLFL